MASSISPLPASASASSSMPGLWPISTPTPRRRPRLHAFEQAVLGGGVELAFDLDRQVLPERRFDRSSVSRVRRADEQSTSSGAIDFMRMCSAINFAARRPRGASGGRDR